MAAPLVGDVGASMGPGSRDPGNLIEGDSKITITSLQWGRDHVIPEINKPFTEATVHAIASMGPGSRDPGNACCRRFSQANRKLQWGRDHVIPEMNRVPGDRSARAPEASMGPGSRDPGNISAGCLSALPFRASMGPGSRDPGNEAGCARATVPRSASMGPGSRDPGNVPPQSASQIVVWLQWGRDHVIPEIRL